MLTTGASGFGATANSDFAPRCSRPPLCSSRPVRPCITQCTHTPFSPTLHYNLVGLVPDLLPSVGHVIRSISSVFGDDDEIPMSESTNDPTRTRNIDRRRQCQGNPPGFPRTVPHLLDGPQLAHLFIDGSNLISDFRPTIYCLRFTRQFSAHSQILETPLELGLTR